MIAAPSHAADAVGRDVLFTSADFRRIAAIIHAEAGIFMPESAEPLVYSRLVKRLRQLGLANFAEYIALVDRPAAEDERRFLISMLTTNTTRFFRESHHFDLLEREVLPPLLDHARKGGRVRLWSAGCSSGEEAYSIAFSVLRLCPEVGMLDLRILATDIDTQILARAEDGRYPRHIVAALPDIVEREFFDPSPTGESHRRVGEAARRLIAFRPLNLIRPWPVRGPFDVVFCRNVAIYFDAETQDRIWSGFSAVMTGSSYFFIGHSERLSASVRGSFDIVGMTAFRKRGATPPVITPGDRQNLQGTR